ncbi:hypothetical protein F4777DRAFT_579197 [Nemania sp. FL0916]|nr:hypothetical protein F4777DRAFT_579197 [Nemania sp. FL0916]
MVRLREEAGKSLHTVGDESSKDAVASLVPPSVANSTMELTEGGNPQPPASPLPSTTDANLAPGTASGVSAGLSAMADAPVDWDLWQSVVYEGPAARLINFFLRVYKFQYSSPGSKKMFLKLQRIHYGTPTPNS